MTTSRRRALAFAGALLLFRPAWAGPTERVVVDPVNGLALGGVDPVSYFLLGRPEPGKADHESRWEGAYWRFASAGNREAFLRHPAIYAPRFGGHDPVRAAEGFVAQGDPALFVLFADRLFLFASPGNAQTFLRGPAPLVARADRQWPRLAAGLAG